MSFEGRKVIVEMKDGRVFEGSCIVDDGEAIHVVWSDRGVDHQISTRERTQIVKEIRLV